MSQIIHKNTYPDMRAVVFDEAAHTYHIDGVKYNSVTSVIKHFSPPFDPTGQITARKAAQMGIAPEELKAQWKAKSQASLDRGHAYHAVLEQYVIDPTQQPEWPEWLMRVIAAMPWLMKRPDALELFPEQIVADAGGRRLCGTADLLVLNKLKNQIMVFDLKTNEEIKRTGYQGEKMLGACGMIGLQNCDLDKYRLQLSIYAYFIRQASGAPAVHRKGTIIHVNHADEVELIEVDLIPADDVRRILDEYCEARDEKLTAHPEVIARQMAIGFPDGFTYSRADIARLADIIYTNTVGAGTEDALDAYIKLKAMTEVLALVEERIKSDAIDEAERYNRDERTRLGVGFQTRNTGRTQYPACEARDTARAEQARIEKLMKDAHANGLTEIADPQTGELIPAATKTNSMTLVVTFPKA